MMPLAGYRASVAFAHALEFRVGDAMAERFVKLYLIEEEFNTSISCSSWQAVGVR